MTKKSTRILGAAFLLGALVAVWVIPRSYFPTHSDRTIVTRQDIASIAVSYLISGLAAGFGIALLLWPFELPDQRAGRRVWHRLAAVAVCCCPKRSVPSAGTVLIFGSFVLPFLPLTA
jgi:hypothetical protein